MRKETDGRALVRDAAGRGDVIPVMLDVTDAGQIAAAVETVTARVGDAGLAALVTAALPRLRRGSSPDVVADTIAGALAARRPRTRYLVGKDSRRLAALSAVLPDRAFDAIRRRLFDLPAPGSLARES